MAKSLKEYGQEMSADLKDFETKQKKVEAASPIPMRPNASDINSHINEINKGRVGVPDNKKKVK